MSADVRGTDGENMNDETPFALRQRARRKSGDASLYLKRRTDGSAVWYIRCGKKRVSTGCFEDQRDEAEVILEESGLAMRQLAVLPETISRPDALQREWANDPKIAPAKLRELVDYNPETGECFLLSDSVRRRRSHRLGYEVIFLGGHEVGVHRVAWAYMTGGWPNGLIDHIDRNPSNNRFANLRLADHAQNCWNQKISKANTTGFKGIVESNGVWLARIQVRGRFIHLGTHGTKEDAAEAYAKAALHYQGEFAPDFIKKALVRKRRRRDLVEVPLGTVDLYVLTQALRRAKERGLLEAVCHDSCSDRVFLLLEDAKRRMDS